METAGNRNQRSRRREEKVRDLVSVMAQMASIGTAMKSILPPSYFYDVLMVSSSQSSSHVSAHQGFCRFYEGPFKTF